MNYDNDIEDVEEKTKEPDSLKNIIILFIALFIVYKVLSFNSALLLGIVFITISVMEVNNTLKNKVK